MSNDAEAVKPLIEEIRALPVAEKTKIGAVALVNLIPYAGGAVASVIGEVATRRKFEKVCDVLSDLNARDSRKLDALKRGLGYAFVTADLFERKQVFLQVLRACTSLELALLPAIYESSDPYEIHEGHPPPQPSAPQYGVLFTQTYDPFRPRGDWRAVRNEARSQPTFLKFLAERVDLDEAATEGAVRLLDGKGLAAAGANLHRSECTVSSSAHSARGQQNAVWACLP